MENNCKSRILAVSCVLVAFDGLLAAHYEYAPFGKITVGVGSNEKPCATGQVSHNPFRFSSEYNDTVFDLAYYNYRHYEPMCGHWMSRDIIGVYGGVNESVYCINGPTIHGDILGLESTPDKHRYENASFVEDTREYNSLEVDCESRAKKLKTIENVRTEYTKREMWSLLRKDK